MVPRRFSLTTRGALALAGAPASAVAGALLGAEELVLLAVALATMLLCGFVQGAYRGARARSNWRVTLELSPADAEVNGRLTLTVTLAAAGQGGAVPTFLEDPQPGWRRVGRTGPGRRPPSHLPNPTLTVRVPPLASGATAQFRFVAPTEARGVFTRDGPRLWCFDSFGFTAQLVAVGPSATITVHPAPAAVSLGPADLRGDWSTTAVQPEVSSARPRPDTLGDFSGLRPYVPGDRLRLLYWPALARTGELMVRHFEDAGPHRVQVVADLRALVGPAGVERVLAAVAAVGLQVLAQGSVLELSTTTGERLAVGPGPLGATALLRAIAGLEAEPPPAAPAGRRWRIRRGRGLARPPAVPSPPGPGELHAAEGTPLVVTTAEGAADLPSLLGYAHLVLAP
jgi:uncharacterized protein (DUF58 family)